MKKRFLWSALQLHEYYGRLELLPSIRFWRWHDAEYQENIYTFEALFLFFEFNFQLIVKEGE